MADPSGEIPQSNKPDAPRTQSPTSQQREQWAKERFNTLAETQERQKVESLQQKLTQFVERGQEMSARGDNDAVLDTMQRDFEPAYRDVPDGYFLKIGLTPAKWNELRQDSDLQLLAQKEQTPTGPQYFLKVPRYVGSTSEIPPNTRYLKLFATNVGNRGKPTLGFSMESNTHSVEMGRSLKTEDITSIQIAKATPKP